MSEDHDDNPQRSGAQLPPPAAPEAHPHEMRLHPARPAVTRLSRKVLLGLSVAGTLVILAALGVALWPHAQAPQSESVNTGNRNTPEGLAGLPKDYAELAKATPKLGPPLPGDLGKPMLNAGVTPPPMPKPQLTPEQQRIVQEQDAARTSHLFAINNTVPAPQSAAPASLSGTIPQVSQASSDPTSTENMQENKIAFANSAPDINAVSPARVQHPASPYVLQAGWVINAALAKGMNSDLPGDIHAQVTQNVYDSPTGRYLLIPQGSMLEGKYNSQVSFGQTRMQMIWTRLIFPNGNWISLGHLPGADGEGNAGVEDGVDEHWGSIFKAAVLSTVLSVGAEAGTSDTENNLAQAIRAGASQSINQAGEQIVERNLNIQPTLTARFGLPVTVTVDQDLILEPYGQEAQR
jgi:type IV secretion system protein TrbI